MAIEYRMLQPGNHIRVVGTGNITPGEFIGLVQNIISDPHHQPESTALIDLREATYAPMDNEEVIRIAMILEAFPSMLKNHIAIVARKATLFSAEIFATHVRAVTNVGIQVFVDIHAAEAFCMENADQEMVASTG